MPPIAITLDNMKFMHASGSKPLDGYTIQRGLGAGGFGEVYFAVSDAGKEVALKRIQRNLDVEVRGVRQCLNLKHPNLLSLHDIKYDSHGDAWVVMEFVAGDCLRDVIARHPEGMPAENVNAWLHGIGAGVAYLHDSGIVHRDLKPANIFSDQGLVKIGDYGLSKFISCSRRSGQTDSVGTFHYMAPEIGRGSYGREIDIYALGVILFEMLTGRLPFDGESSHEIIMKHLTETPDVSVLPVEYRDVVAKALQKEPVKRFSRVAEMLDTLRLPTSTLSVGALTPPQGLITRLNHGAGNGNGNGGANGSRARVCAASPPATNETEHQSRAANAPQSPSSPSDIVLAQPVSPPPADLFGDEPIAAAVRSGWRSIKHQWHQSSSGHSLRWAFMLVLGLVVLFMSPWIATLGFFLAALYIVYFGLRTLVSALSTPAVPINIAARESAAPSTTQAASNARARFISVDDLRAELLHRAPIEHSTSLFGSLLTSAFAVAVLALVMMVLGGHSIDISVASWTFYAWFVGTATLGAWLVMFFGKLWEPKDGDDTRRRFVMLVAGLALGAFSFELAQYLTVSVADDWPIRAVVQTSSSFYNSYGVPKLPAYLAYFAAPLALLRWWKQADPLRSTRMSLWDAAVCAGCGGLVHLLWPFGQPWGMMLFGTISLAVQLSAPWIPPAERLPNARV